MEENAKIKELRRKLNESISYYESEIQKEIDLENAKVKFSYKRFVLMCSVIILCPILVQGNSNLFPDTSIFSWNYYFNF